MCEISFAEQHFTREVLCRMIEVACFDASVRTQYADPYRQKEADKDRVDAEAWMLGERECPLPFEEVCHALGFDPDIFRNKSIKK